MGSVCVQSARPNLTLIYQPSVFVFPSCSATMQLYEEADRAQVPSLTKHQGAKQEENSISSLFRLARHLTFTGLRVAEKASCRAQHASRHISSVNTGPAVTRTYLPKGESRVQKFCVLKGEWNTGLPSTCSTRLPVSSLLPSTSLVVHCQD